MNKIIHIVLGKANPNRMNGVNKVAHNLATAQVDLGYDVEIIGLSNTPEIDKIERKYKLLLFTRKKFFLDMELVEYLKTLDGKDTIFHLHGGFIIDFYFIGRLLKKLGIRYIFTSHGSYNKEALQKRYWFKKIFFILFDSYILKNAWKVHFLGMSEYQYIDTMLQNINKIIVPNGQNLDELKFEYSEIKSIQRPIFGFVGRIDIYVKGLDILFDGFLEYKRKGGNGILWIIGDGLNLKKLAIFVKENRLTEDIIFYGSKFRNEKLNIIANMDVFVHTSRFEGFPMAVLEAAGLGKPIMVSKETNFGEYVKKYNCGWVLEVNKSNEIEQKLFELEKVYLKGGLTDITQNSLKMIENHFGWVKIANEILLNEI